MVGWTRYSIQRNDGGGGSGRDKTHSFFATNNRDEDRDWSVAKPGSERRLNRKQRSELLVMQSKVEGREQTWRQVKRVSRMRRDQTDGIGGVGQRLWRKAHVRAGPTHY